MPDKQYAKEKSRRRKGKSRGGITDDTQAVAGEKYELLAKSLKKVKADLKASEERFKNIIDKNADGIIVIDNDGVVHFINPAGEELFGLKRKDLLGTSIGLPLVDGDASEMTLVRGKGEVLSVELRAVETKWDGKDVYMASMRDITRRKRAEDQLVHNAFHNKLTGLANRALFMDRLTQACERMNRNEDFAIALLFVDIDRFKLINNSIGQSAGDKVLIAASKVLESCLRKVDTIAHLGGDEFVLLLEDTSDLSDVMQVVNRVQSSLASPIEVNGHEVYLSTSIGIRFGSRENDDPEALLRDAETAMHRAKENGGDTYQIFDEKMHTRAVSNLQLGAEIRHALEREEFLIYYQPIVSLSDGRITGFEALLRWQHPERGILAAGQFINVVNELGLIVPICEISLRAACEQNRIWRSMGLPPVYASVNISAMQLRQHDFTKSIARVLKDTGLDPHLLVLELLEDSLIKDVEANLKILHEIREMGIRISVDDFGTGYSSLSYLKRFPINTIKIDRSFVMELPADSEIVTAIITMGKSLNLKIVAEGVETPEQLAFLHSLNCDELQGYLLSKPVPAEDFQELLQKEHVFQECLPGKRG